VSTQDLLRHLRGETNDVRRDGSLSLGSQRKGDNSEQGRASALLRRIHVFVMQHGGAVSTQVEHLCTVPGIF
jgi:hypothetical protein